jgi:hypothetical protein
VKLREFECKEKHEKTEEASGKRKIERINLADRASFFDRDRTKIAQIRAHRAMEIELLFLFRRIRISEIISVC